MYCIAQSFEMSFEARDEIVLVVLNSLQIEGLSLCDRITLVAEGLDHVAQKHMHVGCCVSVLHLQHEIGKCAPPFWHLYVRKLLAN